MAAPEAAAAAVLCVSCRQKPEEASKGRQEGNKFECQSCLAVRMLVYRNLGAGALEEFSPEQKQDFFARSKDGAQGGRYKWPCVRAVLVSKHIERTLTSNEDKVTTASKPQSVWEKEGYSAETLKNCPRWTCPVLGEVVKVPLHENVLREIQETVHEKIMEKERALRDAKVGKAKAKAAAAGFGAEPEAAEAEPDLDVPVLEKTAAGAAKPKQAAKPKEPSARATAAAEKKAKKEAAATHTLAAKVVGPLTAALSTLQSLNKQLAKEGLADAQKDLDDAGGEFQTWKKAATSALQLAEAGVVPVPPLPFSSKDFADHLKSFNTLVKEARTTLKTRKRETKDARDAAAAEAEAHEKAPGDKPPAKRRRVKGT
ncbi:unnamed protein product [Symbiodinium sp. CCMP2592]|nr:unnamed protein product [Symbiodinium sp. CCMP2592]